jgi:hypothetical protein
MSDEPVAQPVTDGVGASGPAATPKSGGIKGFFATTLGKVVIIGLAVTVLLTVLGVVAVIVLGAVGFSLLGDAASQLATSGSTVPTATVASKPASATIPAVADVTNSEVFTPRDPFQPVILPASALEGIGSEATDPDTLTLLEIIEENGVLKAVLQLGADKHTLSAGEIISGTPWQVVSVGSSSAVMMYGDTQITLTVGQGISMK